MTYPANVVQVLLSSPSDLPENHKDVIRRAIRIWNSDNSAREAVVFVPTDWQDGASSTFGERPQATINRQVVEASDMAIVVFTSRLGTPTDDYLSGTVEEIELMLAAGKRVSILRNNVPRPAPKAEELGQLQALTQYLENRQSDGLIFPYDDTARLEREVTKILNDEARQRTDDPAARPVAGRRTTGGPDLSAGVWPSVETEPYQETDNKGRLRTKTRRYLVLTNQTGLPVTKVSYRYEGEGEGVAGFDIAYDSDNLIPTMAPSAKHRHQITQVMGSPSQADCVVTWTAPDGTEHERKASVSIQ